MAEKTCKRCAVTKPADAQHFRASKAARDGLDSYCRDCGREISREHYQANKDRYRENARAYRSAHPEVNRKKRQEWRDRGGVKRYDRRKPEKVRMRGYRRRWRQWLRENPMDRGRRDSLLMRLQLLSPGEQIEGLPQRPLDAEKAQALIEILQEERVP